MGRTFSVKDIAERHSVTEHTVLGWILKTHELKAINVGRRLGAGKPRWRVTEEALKEFEQLRSTVPAPPPRTRR